MERLNSLARVQIGFSWVSGLPSPCTCNYQRLSCIVLRLTNPVRTHLHHIRLAIFVFSEVLMPGTAADSIAIFKDHKVIDGFFRQNFLFSLVKHLQQDKPTHCCRDSSHPASPASVSPAQLLSRINVQNSDRRLLALSLLTPRRVRHNSCSRLNSQETQCPQRQGWQEHFERWDTNSLSICGKPDAI